MNMEISQDKQSRKSATGHIAKVDQTRVVGWAFDPSETEVGTIVDFILDDAVIETITTDVSRPDLMQMGFPLESGFAAVLSLPPGVHRISAVTRQSRRELRGSPFVCTVPQPAGLEVDVLTGARICGRIVNADSQSKATALEFYLDGVQTHALSIKSETSSKPQYADQNFEWKIPVPEGLKSRAISIRNATTEEWLLSNLAFPATYAFVEQAKQNVSLRGWAINRQNTRLRPKLRITRGGEMLGHCRACLYRNDLLKIGDGFHGFNVPITWKDGLTNLDIVDEATGLTVYTTVSDSAPRLSPANR
jgi:hypothetical protein